MSRIFLSHSSADEFEAVAIKQWLMDNGWDDVFLDNDPLRGLAAGERWQEAMRRAADRCEELAHRLAVFGKWSMLDVMVVGLLVVIVKIRGMVAVNVHAGVYLFAVSVILTMLMTASIGKMLATRRPH